MKLFLDSSVALAASLSATGASRLVFDLAIPQGWTLLVSPWARDADDLKHIAGLELSTPFAQPTAG